MQPQRLAASSWLLAFVFWLQDKRCRDPGTDTARHDAFTLHRSRSSSRKLEIHCRYAALEANSKAKS